MSQMNINVVQNAYAAFGRGDSEAVVAACAPDVSWNVTGSRDDYPTMGVWNGTREVREFFRLVGETEEFSEFTPKQFYSVDDKVFVLGHYALKVRQTGKPVVSDWAHVFTFKGGKIVAFREFNDSAQFVAAYRD
jgi:ketosteroid isomerase-like protein